jgi:hypothetical protein
MNAGTVVITTRRAIESLRIDRITRVRIASFR